MVCDMETAGESCGTERVFFFCPTGVSQAHASDRVCAGWDLDGKTTWKTNQRGFQFSTWVLCGCINKTDPLWCTVETSWTKSQTAF